MFDLGRILTGLATFAAVLMGAALGVPALIDWDHLRGPLEARAQALAGAPVRIDGRITVQLLPAPRLSLGDVVLERAEGRALGGAIRRVRVRLSLQSLLMGTARPAGLTLSGADLFLDRAHASRGGALPDLPLPLIVADGSLRFEEGGEAEITGLALRLDAPGGAGQRQVRASGTFAEAPFALRAVLDGRGALHSAALDFGEGEAAFSMARAEGGIDIALKLTRGRRGPAFLGRLLPDVAHVVRPHQAAQLGPLAMTLRASPDGGAFALSALEVTAGPVRLGGGGRFVPGARPALDVELGARTLVPGGGAGGFDPSGLLRVLGQLAEWGGRLDGGIRLYADHIVAAGTVLRGGEIRLAFGPGGTRLRRFRLALPGGGAVSGHGLTAEPGQLAAAFRVEGAQSGGAAVAAQGRLVLSGTRALLQDMRLTAGPNALKAEAALFFGARTALELHAAAERLDLRPYNLARDDLAPAISPDTLWDRLRRLADAADITARIELGAVRLTDATLRDGVLDLALDREQVVLRRLAVTEEDGRIIEARLRAPLTPAADGGGPAQDWTARAEAALDMRPVHARPHALAWRASLWDGMLSVETDAPVRGRLTGRLSRTGGEFQWTDVKGRIGRAVVSGQLELAPGAPPVLHGRLRAEKAVITFEGDSDEALWPGWKLADFWPRAAGLRLDWAADDLTIAGARLTAARGTALLEGERARVVLAAGKLYGGAASGTAALSLGPDGAASWEAQGVIQQADLAEIMGGGWQGRGLVQQSTSGTGASIAEIVAGLRGTLGVNFASGRIGGFDAAALAASPGGPNALRAPVPDKAFGAGATAFRRLEGEVRIGSGEISLSGISAQTEAGPVMLSGVVSLPARLIAAQADIAVAPGAPPLSVQFIGRLEAPERVVDGARLSGRMGE